MSKLLKFGNIICLIICATVLQISTSQSQEALINKQSSSGINKWLDDTIQIEMKNKSFLEMLSELKRLTSHSFIADGASVKKTIDLKFKGKTSELLEQVASYFDYSWRVNPGGAILMNKTFLDHDDRPQSHPEEMNKFASDMLEILDTNPDLSNHDTFKNSMQQLANTLSTAQIDALKPDHYLPASALSSSQFEMLQKATQSNIISDSRDHWFVMYNFIRLRAHGKFEIGIRNFTNPYTKKPDSYDFLSFLANGRVGIYNNSERKRDILNDK